MPKQLIGRPWIVRIEPDTTTKSLKARVICRDEGNQEWYFLVECPTDKLMPVMSKYPTV